MIKFAKSLAIVLAVAAAGCADDSGPVRSVWRPESGKPTYTNVVYVTDREPDAAAAGGFGHRWADKDSCGTAETVVPAALAPGEKPLWGYIAKTTPTACRGSLPYSGAVALVEAQAKEHHCNTVFLFVHGFHTGFDGSVLRAAQVSHDTQTNCAVLSFSWSSEVSLDRYAADIEHSSYAVPMLSELLRELADSGLRVTILGHSSGARMLLASLSGFAHSRFPVRGSFIDELVLAAPDVGAEKGDDDFAHLLADASPYAKRITIYVSHLDGVLLASQYAHGGVPRAGTTADLSFRGDDKDHVIDVIESSQPPADLLDHSYFAMSYETIADMTMVLDGVPTADRMKPWEGWKPTLTCGATTGCGNGALSVATTREPRLVTRILHAVMPLIPFLR
ncbi:MAG: alpha/beta hydrolase [Alphaproteobacteria bacterium]|nr:alpha/beta hydrolase [Alphaproteobacteria bacterium]